MRNFPDVCVCRCDAFYRPEKCALVQFLPRFIFVILFTFYSLYFKNFVYIEMKVRNTYLTAIHNTYGTFIASKSQ